MWNMVVLAVDASGNPINFSSAANTSFAPDTIATDGPVTLTGANIVNSVVATGLSDGASWTFPTAAQIVAAVSGATPAQTFRFNFTNLTGFPITTVNNTGITHTTPDIVQSGTAVAYSIALVSITSGAEAVTITREWSTVAGS
jgi:hypothetical protein